MWFKNLQIFRLPVPWDMSAERLEEQLAKKPFHPCGSQDMESRGWLSPLGNEVLVHAVGGQFLLCLGFEHRLAATEPAPQVLEGRCPPPDEAVPYAGLLSALERFLGLARGVRPTQADLARLAAFSTPSVARVLGSALAASMSLPPMITGFSMRRYLSTGPAVARSSYRK